MSPVSSRRLVTTGSLTLALALAAPSAAFADPGRDRGQAPTGAGDARSDRAPGPRGQAAPASAAAQEQDRPEKGRSEDAPAGEQPAAAQGEAKPANAGSGSNARKPANAGSGSNAGKPANAGSGSNAGKPANAGSGSNEQAPAAERKQRKRDRGPAKAAPRKHAAAPAEQPAAPQGQGEAQQDDDPAGNNGTIKIDGAPFDSGRGNEPHVGCVFQLDFYGFDAGDTASITFTGQSPTRTDVLHSQTTTISDDAAGGGQDRDATLTFSVDDQLSELLDVEPHPKQGWHVKVAVDVTDAPGGAKQKVFWISCDSDTDEAPGGETPTVIEQPKTPDERTPKKSEDKLPTPQPQTPAVPEQDEGAEQETVVPPVDEADAPQQDTESADSDVPTELTGETEAPATGGTVTQEQPLVVDLDAPQAPAAEVSDDAVVAQTAVSGTTVQTAVSGTTVQAAAAGAAPAERAVVSARDAATPAALPFTGIQDLAALLALGVGALGLGGLANRLARKDALPRHAMR